MTTGHNNTEHDQPLLIEWMPLSAKSRASLHVTKREIPHEGHVLSSKRFVIIAKNANHDDVLLAAGRAQLGGLSHDVVKSRERAASYAGVGFARGPHARGVI